jgi:DNA modification methylase
VTYEQFIANKSIQCQPQGLDTIPALNAALFPHQADVVSWALRLGKAAAFLGTGLGKTLIELEWARCVSEHTGMPVLLFAPLAVAKQTIREGAKFGIKAKYCADQSEVVNGINVTNYERLERFEPSLFSGVVLDESSILKSFDGSTRTALIEAFGRTDYRLAATATPAPNDYTELGNHAEFLGVMNRMEMLAMFFVHDGGSTQDWRLKGHAAKDFWKWVCSWAVFIRKPSDVGYDDSRFTLPALHMHEHLVSVDEPTEGMLFALPAQTLQERIAARRSTVGDRTNECAEIVRMEPHEQWVIWCNLNSEAEQLTKLIPGAVNLTGSDSPEEKERKLLNFLDGSIRVLVSKSTIMGYGVNAQNCARTAFVGMNDSWEQFYQAVRRFWRFGQTREVHVHIIAASTEGAVLENIKRKDTDAEKMADEMTANVRELVTAELKSTSRSVSHYHQDTAEGEGWKVILGDCVEVAKQIPDNSIHYSIYSPPFESLYTYSNSPRDMGNSASSEQFWDHYKFLIAETFRAMMAGRLVSIHCMNLPTSKVRNGFIGLRDFRGEIIRAFEDVGFIYHSEVCIWKDPVTAMQRTKALGLLHKTIRKDSSMSRQGIADYLVTMRKPGDNPEPIPHTHEEFPVQLWQNYASPVWMDINPSDTLQYRSAREHDDERHICPLQLDVIRRGINLWSNPGDTVWSPFAGIGSEGFVALQMERKFLGSELKQSYWNQARKNLIAAHSENASLFATEAPEEVEA